MNKFISDAGTTLIAIQKERFYGKAEDGSYLMKHCIYDDLKDWHCKPLNLNLFWTISGYWLRAPTSNIQTISRQEQITSYKAYRVERYIDEKGAIHEALSYGNEDKNQQSGTS